MKIEWNKNIEPENKAEIEQYLMPYELKLTVESVTQDLTFALNTKFNG
jgi:hypothetical protein